MHHTDDALCTRMMALAGDISFTKLYLNNQMLPCLGHVLPMPTDTVLLSMYFLGMLYLSGWPSRCSAMAR